MKKILYFLTTAVLMSVVVSSCKKVPLPYDTFEDLQYGAFARLLSYDGAFDLYNTSTSGIEWGVELYDENKGQNIESYTWTVQFIDNNPGYGQEGNLDPVPVPSAQFTKNDFTTNDNGLPSITHTFTFAEAMSALGLDSIDVAGGDVFRFQATITKSDGSTFTADNTGSNIFSSSTFAALFTLNATVVCLPPDDYFTGSYLVEQIAGGSDPFFGNSVRFVTMTTTVGKDPAKPPTTRIFSVDYLGTFTLTMEVDLVCGDVIVPNVPSGVGCGGDIVWATDDTPATYDIFDDSVMYVNLIDDATNDCGLQDKGYVLRLTKQ